MYYLHGGAGAPNFGDELIARQWLDFLRDASNQTVVFSGYRRNVLKSLFSGRYPKVHLTTALSKCLAECQPDFWKSFIDGYHFLDGKRSQHISSKEEDLLRASKVFHLHGGGYINSMWPKHAFYLGLAASLRRNVGCRIIGTGLGITPIPSPPLEIAKLVEEAFASFDVFEVRDQRSFDYVKKWSSPSANLVHGLDDVFLSPVVTNGKGRTLHLCIHSNKHGDKFLDNLDQSFIERFDHHMFWICHYKDAIQFENVRTRWPMFKEVPVEQITFSPLPIGPEDFFITSRFHPHLMAARVGARGQYLAPGVYSKTKHGSVIKLGSRFVRANDNPDEACDCPEMVLKEPQRIAHKRVLWATAVKPNESSLPAPPPTSGKAKKFINRLLRR